MRRDPSPADRPADAAQGAFEPGDKVGWSVQLGLDPGEGVIARPLPPDAGGHARYEVAVFQNGEYSGHLIYLPAAVLYRVPGWDVDSQLFDPSEAAIHLNPYGPERALQLAHGVGTIRYPEAPAPCAYLRLCDGAGEEILLVTVHEWRDAPEEALGAFLDTTFLLLSRPPPPTE